MRTAAEADSPSAVRRLVSPPVLLDITPPLAHGVLHLSPRSLEGIAYRSVRVLVRVLFGSVSIDDDLTS